MGVRRFSLVKLSPNIFISECTFCFFVNLFLQIELEYQKKHPKLNAFKNLFNKTSVSQQRLNIRIMSCEISECLIQINRITNR